MKRTDSLKRRAFSLETLEARSLNDAALGHLASTWLPDVASPAEVVAQPAAALTVQTSVVASIAKTDAATANTGAAIISNVLREVGDKYGIPGLSAAVFIGGKTVAGTAGVREKGFDTPVELNDQFGSGSTTKAMTATLAGVLVEKRVLLWNTTIGKMFPEWRGKIDPQFQKVTLEQLLQHRAGVIADDDASPELIQKVLSYDGDPDKIRLNLGADILKYKSPEPIGTFRYSNGGYAIAGAMLEKATGVTYEKLMQRYVFDPLGMTSATFHPPGSESGKPPIAPVGHDDQGNPVPENSEAYANVNLPLFYPAGSLLRMNVRDWVKFAKLHTGEAEGSARIVSNGTLSRLHRAAPGSPAFGADHPEIGYGLGWGTLPAGFLGNPKSWGPALEHDGSDGNWLSQIVIFPKTDRGILIMANSAVDQDGNDASVAFKEINDRLEKMFFMPTAYIDSDGRTLVVRGTYDDDRITVIEDKAANTVVLLLNGEVRKFSANVIDNIHVELLSGNDQLKHRVRGPQYETPFPISVSSLDSVLALGSDSYLTV